MTRGHRQVAKCLLNGPGHDFMQPV